MFYMYNISQITDLSQCYDAIEFLAHEEEIFKILLEKWQITMDLMEILHVPYEATMILQYKDAPLSDVFGCILKMEFSLKKFINGENSSNEKKMFAQCLLKYIFKRKKDLINNRIVLSAIFFDPRYRNELNADQVKVAKVTIEEWYRKYFTYKNTENDILSHNTTDSFEDYFHNKSAERINENQNDAPSGLSKSEFLLLLADYEEKIERIHYKTSIWSFWLDQQTSYPILFELATMILSIPPTQATAERGFSVLGYVYNTRRTRLGKEMLQDILSIKLNEELWQSVNIQEMENLHQNSH